MWFPWGGFSYGRGDWLTNMFSYFLFGYGYGYGYGYSGKTHTQKTELKPVSEYVYGNSLISRGDYTQSYSRYGYASGYVTGNREYYGQDILGSTMLVTNGAAGVVQKYAYDAYGNNYEGSFSGTNSIGYNGKRYDGGTGWYDYGFRDYDSRTGRFTTVDPIRDGMNWYAYCGGDPINCVDLWGLNEQDYINFENVCMNVGSTLYGIKGFFTGFIEGAIEGIETGKKIGLEYAKEIEDWNGSQRDSLNEEWFNEHPFNPNDTSAYKKFSDGEKAFHLVPGCDVDKYETLEPDEYGGYPEIVWNNTENCEVTTPKEKGTYNRGHGFFNHAKFDVIPWIVLGTGKDDPTTMSEHFNEFIKSIPNYVKEKISPKKGK